MLRLGELSSLYFHRDELADGEGGRLIARHVGHDWIVGAEAYLRLDCAARVTISFLGDKAGEAAKRGPYLHFSTLDGIVFGNHEVLAHIDPQTQRWFILQDGTEWPAMLVRPDSAA